MMTWEHRDRCEHNENGFRPRWKPSCPDLAWMDQYEHGQPDIVDANLGPQPYAM